MALLESEAFVLNGFRYGESSKIITLYSKEFGKFNAIVKGVRNVKARHSGVYENMNLIKIFLNKKENRSLQVISKAEIIKQFECVKSDLDKLAIGFSMLEILNKTSEEYDTAYNAFALLKEVFEKLENLKTNFGLILLYYLYKLSLVQGLDFLSYIENGTFVRDSAYKISKEQAEYLEIFRDNDISGISPELIDGNDVKYLCKVLFGFYSMNYNKFNFLKTNNFLNEILNM
ncbi:MAG: DNA repair protein RecO [Ignavibacteriae bacterium]|nr:DNA repair protein RecO [Ignavibacteriota bacterium]